MKQAKHPWGLHGHPVCGNCARTIRVRHDAASVACTERLQMMPVDHMDFCEDYLALAAARRSADAPA